MRIEGKTILITGGASGLGEGAARYFHSLDANIAILDQAVEAGRRLEQELDDSRAMFVPADVTGEEAVATAIEQVKARFGAIHVNVNCAGIIGPCKVLERDGSAVALRAFQRTVDANLVGTFNVMSKCAAVMACNEPEKDEERGVIINVSSGAAYEGQIGQCAYSASKNGVIGLNLPAARELGALGIRVNAVAPGLFETAMVASLAPKVHASLVDMVEAPRRAGRPSEFAHCCAFIVENAYLNGETIRLDAATRMRSR